MPDPPRPGGWPVALPADGRDLASTQSVPQATPAPPHSGPPGHRHHAHRQGLRLTSGWHRRQNPDAPADSGVTATGGRPAVPASTPAPGPCCQPPGQAEADQWSLHDHLELGALPGAVPCARLHARQVLWEWQLTAFSENAELLVSELVTNAVQASPSAERIPPVGLLLCSDRSRLLIQVHDTNPHPPEPTSGGGGDDESGRGLRIVEAISAKWGWHKNEDGSGKTVWALIEDQ